MLVRSLLALVSGALLPSCLTQNVQFDVPRNFPPSLTTPETARHPLNSVIQLPTELGAPSGDGGSSNAIDLLIQVRDPNLEQRLQYRVFVDHNPALPPTVVSEGPIPPALPSVSDRLVRDVFLDVPFNLVSAPGCHRIEVFVSTAFRNAFESRVPREEGDLATATWWVSTQQDVASSVDMRGCP